MSAIARAMRAVAVSERVDGHEPEMRQPGFQDRIKAGVCVEPVQEWLHFVLRQFERSPGRFRLSGFRRRGLQHRQVAFGPGRFRLGCRFRRRRLHRRWLCRRLDRQMPGRLRRASGLRRRRVQPHFALAAIAAAQTLLTEVIIASVLGASRADARGFFSAYAALKRHEMAISFLGPAR